MTTPDNPAGACSLCDVVKPDERTLRDHVLNVHPDEHCAMYHQQPCQQERRERYMAALLEADPYALVQLRDDRARFADAVMAVADAEIPAVLRAVADMAESLRQFEPATGPRKSAQVSENVGVLRVVEWLRRIADAAQTRSVPDSERPEQPQPADELTFCSFGEGDAPGSGCILPAGHQPPNRHVVTPGDTDDE